MQVKDKKEIHYSELKKILDTAGIIILPFDTCYGVCCDPTNVEAVKKLLKYKERPAGKPISIAVDSISMAQQYVELNDVAKNFYKTFLPGAYTVISKSRGLAIRDIESENGNLGIRIPDHNWLLDFITFYGKPIISTSANKHYQKTPYKVQDILENATKKNLELIDLIVDSGTLPKNPPSTVLDTTTEDIEVLRQGKDLLQNAKFTTNSDLNIEGTIKFAQEIIKNNLESLKVRPLILCLEGEMGAGKTQFTRGVCSHFTLTEEVSSPTFILMNEYTNEEIKIIHIDTWRMEKVEDMLAFELEKLLDQKRKFYPILCVEWADKFRNYLQTLDINKKLYWIKIEKSKDDVNTRTIHYTELSS